MKLLLPVIAAGLAASLALVACQAETTETTPSTENAAPEDSGEAKAQVVSLKITGMT